MKLFIAAITVLVILSGCYTRSWSNCAERVVAEGGGDDANWGAAGSGKAERVTSQCGYVKEVDQQQCDLWYHQEYQDCLAHSDLKFDEAPRAITRGFDWYDPDGPIVRSFAYLCDSKKKISREEFGRRICQSTGYIK